MSLTTGNVTDPGAARYYQNSLQTGKSGGKESAYHVSVGSGAVNADRYTAGAEASKGVYSKDSVQMQKAQSLADAHYASMRGAVESLVGGAGGYNGQSFWAAAANGNVKVDEATQSKAQELTSENGYFGVKKTTERIMEFAKALAGTDASEKTIEKLRGGAQAGFDYVAKLFGGFDKLPKLTQDTYDSVMKEFDSWVSGTKLTEN